MLLGRILYKQYSNVICYLLSVLFPVFSSEAVVASAKSGQEMYLAQYCSGRMEKQDKVKS